MKCQTCSNFTIEEVICAAHVEENGDGLLFQKSSNFHHLRVGVAGQCVHCVVGRLGIFLYGFFFMFQGFFRWFIVLILHWFNNKEPALFAAMFSAPRFSTVPTQSFGRSFMKLIPHQFFWYGGSDGNRGGYRPWHGWSCSDPCPSCLLVQSFFLNTRKGNHRHKSVLLSRLYFSPNLRL
ncbi:hypothetical protein BHE74_00004128 [Ensete ventricosum]|nr:hypothetical protein GW17_00037339 [Ensete ventricosum]RWW87066.1 hypothetical protein BHE74_00004128 [Ensete ventricosum]RZR77613.1 hypothetical protein BHM03_00002725 [Ensete ventricosum]